jgi:SPP1 family predicted phage head-tail adaptor
LCGKVNKNQNKKHKKKKAPFECRLRAFSHFLYAERERRRVKITDLRQRITLQKKLITKDPEGIPMDIWQDIATIWAAIEPLRGREYFQAATVQSQNMIRFTIRYRKGITSEIRILYDSKFYDIQSVIDVNGCHQQLELMAKEVTSHDH